VNIGVNIAKIVGRHQNSLMIQETFRSDLTKALVFGYELFF